MVEQNIQRLLVQCSFIELGVREWVWVLFDVGSFCELLDFFVWLMLFWLFKQGIVFQVDDGVVVVKGLIDGQFAVVIAIEGVFQGGSLGEVGGVKIVGVLELVVEDNKSGMLICAVLLLEIGGVRLQEVNLGLVVIVEIQVVIVELREFQLVIGLVAGSVGCFGGMFIVVGVLSMFSLRFSMLGPSPELF